jgi:hypothetical protein
MWTAGIDRINEQQVHQPLRAKLLPAALAAWIGCLGLDFLLHGVFLASWWRATARYWLPPRELLEMIPLSYVAFAIYGGVVTWLLARLYGDRLNLRTGLRFGAVAGAISGVASVLAAYSVFRLPPLALVVWPASFTLESAIAGAAGSWTLVAERPWRRAGLVFGLAVIFLILGVVIQNLLFPTPADHVFQ